VLAIVNPEETTIHMLAELGVLILLFEIGLDSDLGELLRAGGQSLTVAVAGMAFPFLFGWGVMAGLGYPSVTSVFVGATLTATSIGITARVLADMGKLGTMEAKIIIGAAVIDDILGLVVLSLVRGLAQQGEVSVGGAVSKTLLAIGFFVAAVVGGRLLAPHLVRIAGRMRVRGVLLVSSLSFAFLVALAAHAIGSATIVGAFAAGLILARTDRKVSIEEQVRPLSDFFVPIFFATVGAAVDIRVFNPFDPARRGALAIAGLLLVAAVVGKCLAGWAAFSRGRRLRHVAIGVGMIPRGEVGLVFAALGLTLGVADAATYAAVIVVVILTTFLTPPVLRIALR
jgi:Kef-type K+ transport system membrane component KefB